MKGKKIKIIDVILPDYGLEYYVLWEIENSRNSKGQSLWAYSTSLNDIMALGYVGESQFKILK